MLISPRDCPLPRAPKGWDTPVLLECLGTSGRVDWPGILFVGGTQLPSGEDPTSGELKYLFQVSCFLLQGTEIHSDHFVKHGARTHLDWKPQELWRLGDKPWSFPWTVGPLKVALFVLSFPSCYIWLTFPFSLSLFSDSERLFPRDLSGSCVLRDLSAVPYG